MAFAEDLLERAQHLAHREKKRPRQASLRRAVSPACYALFHLLISEAVSNWKVPDQRADLVRAFDHNRIANRPFPPGTDGAAVSALRKVAETFGRWQQSRHKADYDNAEGGRGLPRLLKSIWPWRRSATGEESGMRRFPAITCCLS